MTDTTAAAARRWIAERLLWERFLEETSRGTTDEVESVRPAA